MYAFHLASFVNGSPRQLPASIGIPGARAQNTPKGPFVPRGSCYYWLHAPHSIIHIESLRQHIYTLGPFLAFSPGPAVALP
jgi:hypothetical protein